MTRSRSSRRLQRVAALLLAPFLFASVLLVITPSAPALAADNAIVTENKKTGNPASEWDVAGAGYAKLQGFGTKISVVPGESIGFKIDYTDGPSVAASPAAYRIDIYRLGYYAGAGARKVDTISANAIMGQHQPACNVSANNGYLVDCANWSLSASWTVPSGSVSGIYIARPTMTSDSSLASHIVFVVRNDTSGSAILVQASDTTWQAYNPYGGYDIYATGALGHSQKESYNRPFTTRGDSGGQDWLFNSEYPMLRWLERNGYDVSYTTDTDTGLHPAELLEHKVFMSSGHDEYWSQEQRDAVEAARDAGVNLAFFSGNEIYWKVRFEDSQTAGDGRTMVVYKEGSLAPTTAEHYTCLNNFACDPSSTVWTGLWREKTNSTHDKSVIGEPENALSGQISWRDNTTAITVPGDYASLRFWRNTGVASLTSAQSVTLGTGTLGYEWSPWYEQYAHWYPAGRVPLSRTVAVPTFTGPGVHSLSLYRADSGALVFGAGTVQWAWGLDTHHDGATTTEDANMQQATVNLLADMGAQPTTLQATLSSASKSTDNTPPTVSITSPANGATVTAGPVTVTGTASDTGGVVGVVEVSTDNGYSWHPATGRGTWSYTFNATAQTTIRVRAADDSANLGAEAPSRTISVQDRSCAGTCSIFPDSVTGTQQQDPNGTEVGVKFRSSAAGYVTGIRFYKNSGNTGTHVGTLWSAGGTQLARVNFGGESGSGWQQATFSSPVHIAANTTYVASYFAPNGAYSVGTSFENSDYAYPPLRALQDGEDGPNGLYVYAATSTFPTMSYGSANYLVDVVFTTTNPDTTPPKITGKTPADGATGVARDAAVTITFSEPLDPTTVTPATVLLQADGSSSPVPASVTLDGVGTTVTLTPTSPLALNTHYTVTVATGVQDLAGNPLASAQSWSFTSTGGQTLSPGTPTISDDHADHVNGPQIGDVLTVSPGDWVPVPDFSYQWLRGTSPISGATGATYAVTGDDVGAVLSVEVTATKTGYTTLTRSAGPTKKVVVGTLVTATPTISGKPAVGEVLTAAEGTWGPTPVTMGYQWLRNSAEITGATARTFTVTAADAGAALSVRVTGSKAGYTTVATTSATVTIASGGKLTWATPKVSDTTPVTDQTLTATTAGWGPAGITLSYQWYRKSPSGKVKAIAGATGVSYQVAAANVRYRLRVKVTGSLTGSAPVSVSSSWTSKVAKAHFVVAPKPTIPGDPRVGTPLTADPGTWTATPTRLAYQWYYVKHGKRVAIRHATKATYVPTASRTGRQLVVRVKAYRSGYVTTTRYSDRTAKLVPA